MSREEVLIVLTNKAKRMKVKEQKVAKIPKKKKKNWKHWIPFYIMFLPGFAYLLINNYMPLYGLQLAFKQFSYRKGITGSDWIGWKNFKFLFASSDATRMERNQLADKYFQDMRAVKREAAEKGLQIIPL